MMIGRARDILQSLYSIGLGIPAARGGDKTVTIPFAGTDHPVTGMLRTGERGCARIMVLAPSHRIVVCLVAPQVVLLCGGRLPGTNE
jgi:hypothetical protein